MKKNKVLALLISIIMVLVMFLPITFDILQTQTAFAEETKNDFAKREWKFANVGSNADGSITYNTDGSVTIVNVGGKFADSEEGFSFYYTEIDAETENFYVSASFKVDEAADADNQSALGVIAIDTLAPQGTGKYVNYASSGCFKLTGTNAGYRLPGARFVSGYVIPDGTSPTENPDGSGTQLRYCDMENSFGDTTPFGKNSTYNFQLKKSNSGYHATMKNSDEEFIMYGAEKLLVQNTKKVYVGFFVSRKITVTISDMVINITDPKTDPPKVEPPEGAIPLEIMVYSPTSTTSLNYDYLFTTNASGKLTVTDSAQKVLIDGAHVEANEYYSQTIRLSNEKTNVLKSKFVPDSEKIAPISVQTIINYNNFNKAGKILYAKDEVEFDGDGTIDSPISIYSALKYAKPGQTIVLLDGVYKLTRKLTIERGISGTKDNYITIIPQTPNGVIIDCTEMNISSGEAFWIAGDYWHIYGLTLCNAPNSAKGIRISGNNNILEMCTVYSCGNTGIQISGSSKEPFERWPSNNLIKNCTSYKNCDPTRQDADGFAAKLTCGEGNKLFGCISYNNIDDGYDLYAKSITGNIGAVVIENCIAYNNGFVDETGSVGEGNGFKLGGESLTAGHTLINSIAYNNGAKGITSNSCPDIKIVNCISFNNSKFGNIENVSLYSGIPSQSTAFSVNGLLSIMSTNSGKADKFALKNQESIFSEKNFIFNGTNSVNSKGDQALLTWFESVEMVEPTRNEDGTINMRGFLTLNSSANANSGARLDYSDNAKSKMPELPSNSPNNILTIVIVVVSLLIVTAVVVVIVVKCRKSKTNKQSD